jgi:predicted small secreted protein
VRPARIAPLAAIALTLAACGTSPPAHSASAACTAFSAWVKAQAGNLDAGKDMSQLRQAVSDAPSGSLYQDLGTVLVNVTYARHHPEAGQVTQPDVAQVQADCASVSPG